MLNNEIYWTEEYILYAEMIEKRDKEKAKLSIEKEKTLQEPETEKETTEC